MAGGWLAGKTWAQILRRLSRIVINLDPDAARKRREAAERGFARVVFSAEGDGTARLGGYNLPADEALQADAQISARARAYRQAGLPGSMELLRAQAFLDILAGLDRRAGTSPAPHGSQSTQGSGASGDGGVVSDGGGEVSDGGGVVSDGGGEAGDGGTGDLGGNEDGGAGESGYGDGDGSGGGGPRDGGGPGTGDGFAANVDLTIPLATLLGIAERAGEADWLGAIDPGLARGLALRAAANPRSSFRIVVTDQDGYAAGFGIARRRPDGTGRRRPGRDRPPPDPAGPASTRGTAPMAGVSRGGPGSQPALPGLAPARDPGRAGGLGTWRIRIGDLDLTADLHVIDRDGCGHELATTAYRPTALLRALVQIRDGKCSLPICARHPRGTEWEHGLPWPEGRTCACNGGLHCKRDHLLKQSDRWSIRQLPDGRRIWTTPTGLEYTSHLHDYAD